MNFDHFPLAIGAVYGPEGQVVVACPFCGRAHHHGASKKPGTVGSHCLSGSVYLVITLPRDEKYLDARAARQKARAGLASPRASGEAK